MCHIALQAKNKIFIRIRLLFGLSFHLFIKMFQKPKVHIRKDIDCKGNVKNTAQLMPAFTILQYWVKLWSQLRDKKTWGCCAAVSYLLWSIKIHLKVVTWLNSMTPDLFHIKCNHSKYFEHLGNFFVLWLIILNWRAALCLPANQSHLYHWRPTHN